MTGEFVHKFSIFLVLLPCIELCSLPNSIQIHVPQTIPAGIIPEASDFCDNKLVNSSDPDIKVRSDNTLEAASDIPLPETGKTFFIWAEGPSGQLKRIGVHLFHNSIQKRQAPNRGLLRRSKRRWSPPPFDIKENNKGPFPIEMDVIGSDSQALYDVFYTISGPGVTEYPLQLFSVNRDTGMLSVHKTIDREEFPEIVFTAQVFDKNTGVETDLPLPITIVIGDENDNSPTFTDPLQFRVMERSPAGTVVGQVNTADKDEQGTLHTKIRCSLLTGINLFAIDPTTGVITTITDTLDREEKDTQMVTVQIKDMDGATNGLATTGTATITLDDINDNPPTFLNTPLKASVDENESGSMILRIPVEDKDLKGTPNWNTFFEITKGNEDGYFRIERDPETNDGLLYLNKPLNYEQKKTMALEIMALNEAKLSSTTASWVKVPLEVTVGDVDEGPEFIASNARFVVREDEPVGHVIGTNAAIDPETKSSDGITYYKVKDPASWISVDKNSGELKVASEMDRESNFVKNGIYNITMKAVDSSMRSSTGMVEIVLEDVNDNKPEILGHELTMCERDGQPGSVTVGAVDKDGRPYSGPFIFKLEDDNADWTVKNFNDTAATLETARYLPKGIYTVPIMVKDLQGVGEVQTVTVKICKCQGGVCRTKERSTALGKWGILSLLLGLALVLLFALLCIFFCTTRNDNRVFEDIGDGGGILLKSNTEAPGEEVDSTILASNAHDLSVKGSAVDMGYMGSKGGTGTLGGHSVVQNDFYQSGGALVSDMQNDFSHYNGTKYATGQFGSNFGTGNYSGNQLVNQNMDFDNQRFAQFQNSSVHHTWRTNGQFLNQKLAQMHREHDGSYADDIMRPYGYEGIGSPAGSVGCCSDFGPTENLEFLNTLGPKFKPLADVCHKY